MTRILNTQNSIKSLDNEEEYIVELFEGSAHESFKPRKLYISKQLGERCRDLQANLSDTLLEGIKNQVVIFKDFFNQFPNITDDMVMANYTHYMNQRHRCWRNGEDSAFFILIPWRLDNGKLDKFKFLLQLSQRYCRF